MKVLIIFGGRSTEHEVSCVSAASVLNNIKGHDVTKFGITKDGKWYHTEADNAAVSNGSWETTNPTGKCSPISIPVLLSGMAAA